MWQPSARPRTYVCSFVPAGAVPVQGCHVRADTRQSRSRYVAALRPTKNICLFTVHGCSGRGAQDADRGSKTQAASATTATKPQSHHSAATGMAESGRGLRSYRCSICGLSWTTYTKCQQHCSQPHSRCNRGPVPAAVIPSDIEFRASDRQVGGRMRDDDPIAHPMPRAHSPCEQDDDLQPPNDPPGWSVLIVSRGVMTYVDISYIC